MLVLNIKQKRKNDPAARLPQAANGMDRHSACCIQESRVKHMGELVEAYPRLPKNIRQIGERDNVIRVYVEDYVNTYLKRLFPAAGQDLRAGLLLGNTEEHSGVPYVFIDGALEMEGVTEEGEKVTFSEEAWKRAYQTVEEMFPKRTVQGWFLCGAAGCQLSPLNYWKQHSQYFSGKNKLMYLNSGLEGEEAVYITSSDGFYKLRGYCIYYERNQMMQDYMVMRKDNQRVEAGGSDPVIRDFRRKMEKKKEHANDQMRTIHFLRGMCGCLAILTLAGGVAAFNSAEKMKKMEAVMVSVLPEAESVWNSGKSRITRMQEGKENSSETTTVSPGFSGVLIEEAPGDIFPTAEAPQEAAGSRDSQYADGQYSGQTAAGQNSGRSTSESRSGQNTAEQYGAQGAEASSKQAAASNKSAKSQADETVNGADAEKEKNAASQEAGQARTPEQAPESSKAAEVSGQAETASSVGTAEAVSKETGKENKNEAESPGGDGQAPNSEAESKAVTTANPAPVRQKDAKPGQGIYVVQEGETLYGICFKLYQNLSKVDEICEINGITDVNMLEAGYRLIVP